MCVRLVVGSSAMNEFDSLRSIACTLHALRVFDEPNLAMLVAKYTGGLCANYVKPGEVHGPESSVRDAEEETKTCAACRRILCPECSRDESLQCFHCPRVYCDDCRPLALTKCNDDKCVEQYCPDCAAPLVFTCCDKGRTRAMCRSVRVSMAWNRCWGCNVPMCHVCEAQLCDCGLNWCQSCFAERTAPTCKHGPDCVLCDQMASAHRVCMTSARGSRKRKARQM